MIIAVVLLGAFLGVSIGIGLRRAEFAAALEKLVDDKCPGNNIRYADEIDGLAVDLDQKRLFVVSRQGLSGRFASLSPESLLGFDTKIRKSKDDESFLLTVRLADKEATCLEFDVESESSLNKWQSSLEMLSKGFENNAQLFEWQELPSNQFKATSTAGNGRLVYSAFVGITLVALPYFLYFWESEEVRQGKAQREAEQETYASARRCMDGSAAFAHSLQLVRGSLVSKPTSIDELRTKDVGNCQHWVAGYVVGENAFGGKIGNYFLISMRYEKSSGDWYGGEPAFFPQKIAWKAFYLRLVLRKIKDTKEGVS